jgi:hypothetical protein
LTADKVEVQSFAALRESKCRCTVCSVCQPLSRSSRWRDALVILDPRVPPAPRDKPAPPVLLVLPALRAHKVRKDPSVHKAPSASAGLLVLPDRQDQSDRRVRRARLADKALPDPAASAARQERRDPLVQQGRRAQQVIPARRQQFALSPAWTPFAVRTTRCWPVWFVRWARPTERNAQRPARRQPACVYVGNVKPNLVALLLAAAAITISKERTVPTPFASFSRSQPSRPRALRRPLAANQENEVIEPGIVGRMQHNLHRREVETRRSGAE